MRAIICTKYGEPDVLKLKEFVESKHIKPVLDKCFKLEEIVEAHRYVETGHKKGGVAITVK